MTAPRDPLIPRLPERGMAWVLLRRGAAIWVLVRLMVGGLAVATGVPGGMTSPFQASALMLMVAMVGAIGWLDTRRQYEHRLLANLGVSPIAITLMLVVPTVCGEIAIALVTLR